MTPKEVNEIFNKIFSEGYNVKGITIESKSPVVANIFHHEGATRIEFGANNPKAVIKKFITFYAYIEEIYLGPEKGSLKLRNFPDINFTYETGVSILSFLEAQFSENSDIKDLIETKYSCSRDKKIAGSCLQYAEQWATIVSHSGGFADARECDKKRLKSECYKFVVDNVRRDAKEQRFGFGIGMYILIFILIPTICKFIVYKLLEKYFD